MTLQVSNDLLKAMADLRALLPVVATLDQKQFECFVETWHLLTGELKDAVFVPNPKNLRPDRRKFEFASGAQSIQFMADILPFLHARMERHYDRFQNLKLLDVGAGSAAGTQLIAQLHSDAMIWSRLEVDAVDYVPWRRRWVAVHYPQVNYRVLDSAELPSRAWDFVVCSHVIEHLADPERMIADVLRACRGFAFIYAPYNETELSPGHCSVISEATFTAHGACEIHLLQSMGYYGPGRLCILAIFDRREPTESEHAMDCEPPAPLFAVD